ncbi:ChbG/HpnK family deacetylase [Maribacter sp. ACAM166]|uniref:ChbG/HpnK family deacetylase n=1 Tax=Maribacter sp. ACAM166 TaxID=2508996 RepID=UPI0010FDF18E|nr:ChbG/HpnK family deacetylase [Maribacter sp. ACAM166]TLP79265.1 ChbG/HpnK family deacetylase [Maribacter sp. ACAM166]
MKYLFFITAVLLGVLCSFGQGDSYLVVRGDDMGFCDAANQASIHAYKKGIMKSIEVIVPAPKFYEAAALLRENPGLDVGVHLCLTSEWDNYKWGPLTNAPSLVDSNGYFVSTEADLYTATMDEAEIKNELKAQIDMALKYIPHISHLSTHMFLPITDKRLNKICSELSQEYNLPVGFGTDYAGNFWTDEPDKKEDELVHFLQNIKPGLNVFIMHPALNNEETRAILGRGHDANVRMAIHRQAVTDAITSDLVKSIVQERNIKLISYADAYKMEKK